MANVFCPQCGAQVSDTSAFCTNCGAKMVPATQPVQQAAPQYAQPTQQAAPQYAQPAPQPQYAQPGVPAPGQPGMPAPQPGYPAQQPPKKSNKGCIIAAIIVGVLVVIVLPVVIILGAIAIPAVIGITNSANSSQMESDAATINSACKTYYAGIVSGTITDDDEYLLVNSYDDLPEKGSSATTRKNAALYCTIGGALDYDGSYSTLADKLDQMGVDEDGTIYWINDPFYSDDIVYSGLSTYTYLGTLYD